MGEPDEVMIRISQAMERGQRGDPAGARALFLEVWADIGERGDPLHRCALAHAMADVQDDAEAELTWDLRALAAADQLTDERVAAAGVAGSARSFYPSLHLNLADVYRRLGEQAHARAHVASGREVLDALAEDGYRQVVVDALDRVEAQLDGQLEAQLDGQLAGQLDAG